MLLAAPAAAAMAAFEFNIPEQDLASAIRAIGRQGRVDILFQADSVAGRRSLPVRGRMEAIDALRSALGRQADLEALILADGTLLVRMRRARAGSAPSATIPRGPLPAEEEPIANREIVVTASRRPGLLQAYPGSLTVVPGKDVEKRGRTSLQEAAALVPGLNLTETGPGQRRITMRGLHSAGENSVLLYLDETPVSGPTSATSDVSQMSPDIRLFDVERIEVLRGPQGTLFGSGALGGAVRILFNRPDMERMTAEGAVGASVTERGQPGTIARATVNMPIVPGLLSMRATGYDERRGGYVDNVALGLKDIDDSRTTGGRAMLRLEAGPGYDLTATLLAQQQRVSDASAWYPALGTYRSDNPERLPFPNHLLLYNLTGHARLGAAEVTAAASHYRWSLTRFIDSTRPALNAITNGTYCPLFAGVTRCTAEQLAAYRAQLQDSLPLVGSQPMRVEASTGELRVASTPGEPLTLTGGIFFERRSDTSRSGTYLADPVTGELRVPEQRNFLRTVSVRTRQAAIFGDIGWRVASPLTITVGARRYSYSKTATAQVIQTSYINGAVAGPPTRQETGSEGWTGRVNLAYEPAPSLLVYTQAATGFRPGGVNSVPNLPDALVAFKADSAITYETGFRGSWLAGRLSLSGSAYWTNWRDMQASARIPSFMFVSNSGAARIVGMDMDAEAEVTDDLGIRLALNVLEARLTRNQANAVVAAPGMKGDRIPFEPSVKAVVSAEYRRPFAGGLTSVASADLSYVGASYSDYRPNSPYYERMGDYADLTLRWALESPRWALRMTLANALDGAGKQRVESTVNSEQLTNSQVPRTLSVEFAWKFLPR